MFAVLPFGGGALVLLSAPPGDDASLEGNVFGVLAMLLRQRPRSTGSRGFRLEPLGPHGVALRAA